MCCSENHRFKKTTYTHRKRINHTAQVLLLLCHIAISLVGLTQASASDKLMVEYPSINVGETEIGLRSLALYDKRPDVNRSQTSKFGAGHGFNSIWFSELYAEYEKTPDSSSVEAQYYEWENMFRLTEPGRYWADWAVIMEYSKATDPEGRDAYKLMPIMQKRFTAHVLTLNYGLERNPDENRTNNWQFSYGWQYLWLGKPGYRFALEGYGQVGDVNHWSAMPQQTHQIGPALVGKVRTNLEEGFEYRLGLYFGLTDTTPNQALMASIEYEL